MKKSMYSVVLSDAVIKAIDRLAYERGTSRSGLIDQILAQAVSMSTPQMQIEEVFARASALIAQQNALQIQHQPSCSMLTVKSVINYKYNPAIRYSVELLVGDGEYIGELRVMSRSRSGQLLQLLDSFFRLWVQQEQLCLSRVLPASRLDWQIEEGRFGRRLVVDALAQGIGSSATGEAIGAYLHLFDGALNLFFAEGVAAQPEILRRYTEYLQHTPIVI